MIRKLTLCIIMVMCVVGISCTNYKGKDTNNKLPIYGQWKNVKAYEDFIKMIEKYGQLDPTYEFIVIEPSLKSKKIKEEIAFLHDIGEDFSITEITGEYPKYKIKFKYVVYYYKEDGDDSDYSKWYDGEMYIHFNNYDEIWFELIKLDKPEKNKLAYPLRMIRWGKENIYRRDVN